MAESRREAPISGIKVAEQEVTPLGGTGGAAGAGTRAGEGQPSGEGISSVEDGDDLHDPASRDEFLKSDALPERSEAAREAAALGNLDDHARTPSLEYGEGDRPEPPTIGEAIGSGAGTSVGSGTPPEDD